MAYAIQPRDIAKSADVLSAAFADYPIFQYVLPECPGRSHRLAHIIRFLIRLGLANGEVLAPSEHIEGISIWFRSENMRSSALTLLRAGVASLYLHVGHGVVSNLRQVSVTKLRVRAELLTHPYCLLDMLGVSPAQQGQGFARRMLVEKLHELDTQQLPCYLETSRLSTAKYYEGFGFQIIHRYQVATVDVFCLLRKIGANS